MGSSSDIDRADPVAKAAAMREGEPSGSSSSSTGRWSEERRKAASERMKASHADGSAPKGRGHKKASAPPPEPITEEEERMVGGLVGALWNIGGPMVKLAKLDKDDEHQVGRAACPVIRKYMPMLGDWSAEITLVLTVSVLVTAKRAQWKAEHPDAEIPDLELLPAGVVLS